MDKEATKKVINNMLVYTFHEILDLEEKAIITDEFSDISNNDMHVIEAIGLDQEGSRMSDVAKKLNITVGALTTSMNALVKKKYVERQRCESDRRVVRVKLTEKGIAAFKHHERFHDEMTDALIHGLSDEQIAAWVSTIDILTEFFESQRK